MVKEKPSIDKLTFEKIMNYLSIFFFATLSLIIGIVLYSLNKSNSYALIFGIIFFTGYFYLLLEFFIYCLTQFSKRIKALYKDHYLWFWGIAILIFIILIGYGIFRLLGFHKSVEIAGGIVLMASATGLWKVCTMIWKKYKK